MGRLSDLNPNRLSRTALAFSILIFMALPAHSEKSDQPAKSEDVRAALADLTCVWVKGMDTPTVELKTPRHIRSKELCRNEPLSTIVVGATVKCNGSNGTVFFENVYCALPKITEPPATCLAQQFKINERGSGRFAAPVTREVIKGEYIRSDDGWAAPSRVR